ncbi:MAG: phage holin family protein [Candidatus Caenarcaniphilales bacterium]|nr:phage holin family protein [Candidatus Caenarcaniphilales bacterium]
MIKFIVQLFVNAFAAYWAASLLPGVRIDSFWNALVFAFVLGIINSVLQPVLFFLTLPVTIFTLGIFAFILNALMIWLASAIVPGFGIVNFGWVLLYSLILTIVSAFLNWLAQLLGLEQKAD